MFSCLWQIWEWIDPGKMDKIQKSRPFESSSNPQPVTDQNAPNNTLTVIHQHNAAAHYYPPVHQHPQIYNKNLQQPFQLNINNQQHIHRHFQYYPQYGVNNDFSRQHLERTELNQPFSTANFQQNSRPQINNRPEVVQPEPAKENQANVSKTPKPKAKDGEKKLLRSPVAKRPPNAPVTMQGWLHKQGSEGLMLWKKRWFVLSEYCLFYYKGLQEEKLLGSILLPSYKVSICGPEDKITKKYAFKCEHANMRTYILAADSQDLAVQWVRALNLACNLEISSKSSEVLRNQQHNVNSSGQNQLQSNNNAVHIHSSSNVTELSNSSQQEMNQFNQPLYANAPPKPRRVTEGYCSPSPEILSHYPESGKPQGQRYSDGVFLGPQNIDRRTPDTYGRSNLLKYKHPSDYEDIYMEQSAYKRPLSPMAPDTMLRKGYPTLTVEYPMAQGYAPPLLDMNSSIQKPTMHTISRPHSADFLEYKPNKFQTMPSTTPVSQQPRPKSSLDINMYSERYDPLSRSNSYFTDCQERCRDNDYFYSEEKYAEKMRKSAQYLKKLPAKYHQQADIVRKDYTQNSDIYSYNRPLREEEVRNKQPIRSRSALSEGSLLCAQDIENDSLSKDYMLGNGQELRQNIRINSSQDQFSRSASARLIQSNNFEENVTRIEGERKREESMKRLLEWKQRMLQSPLNRKSQTQAYRDHLLSKENNYMYHNYIADKKQKKLTGTNRRSPHNMAQYNSYSSDDEETGEKSSEHSQAGRTTDTFPNNSDSLAHASFTSTTALKALEPAPSTPQLSVADNQPTIVDISKSGSALALIEPLASSAIDQDQTVLEGNYMPMSPNKDVFLFKRENNSEFAPFINNDTEENHYVEMSRAVEGVLMDSTLNNDQQPYETVCFGTAKMEPVYMEVPAEQKVGKEQNEQLPDILIAPSCQINKEEKADSSDADDEASKDLDSSEMPSQYRFSISDTFRPASYYLGVSKTISEFQDSSDSELMSPPPIPTSSPPLDEEDSILSKNFSQKVRKTCCEIRTSFYDKSTEEKNCDCNESFSGLSSNSESVVSVPPNQHQYFELNEQTALVKNVPPIEDGHAYENFLFTPNNSFAINDFQFRCRPDSSCSLSAEIGSFFPNSNRPSLIVDNEENVAQVPYYYSDLLGTLEPSLTLNNQRESVHGSKRDITRIINPIKCNNQEEGAFQEDSSSNLAEEARFVSADFLNLTDKKDNIDKKNIYESDTLKRSKIDHIQIVDDDELDSRNVYVHRKANKFSQNIGNDKIVRKSYSLEGLLGNVLNVEDPSNVVQSINNATSEGSYLWEEDSVWREQLRSVSQRHTKSMDDLDSIDIDEESIQKRPSRALTRDVTYVNDIVFKANDSTNKKSSKAEIKKKSSFLIDRETLRQWDLMSSAPSDGQLLKLVDGSGGQVPVVDSGEGINDGGDNGHVQEAASGSISINTKEAILGRDTFPRGMPAKRSITPISQSVQTRSVTNLDRIPYKNEKNQMSADHLSWTHNSQYFHEHNQDFRISQNELAPKAKLSVSAGELLGRTHEELVLLLIQLRRQQAQTFQAIESCYNDIDDLQQLHMHDMDQIKRMENLKKLESIKQNLLELEKQYEKRKPLVNLVDNMVKLGTLYRNPNERSDLAKHFRDRLEFNRYVQERRLLAEEKRDWNRIEPSHLQLQKKVKQLYQLDELIQEESRNLHNLQRDKEDIERALGGLRNKLIKGLNNPEEFEQARRQQFMLENELGRVYLMLAQNSKKLEETVAGNARLEQELLVLKQKLQGSRQQRNSPQLYNTGDSLPYLSSTSQVLETDLERVQKKIGDLQKQREELSFQVRQLTDRSSTPNLQQMKQSSPVDNQSFNNTNKKRPTSSWRETDLDTMSSIDHGYDSYSSTSTTLYINTDMRPLGPFQDSNMKSSDSTSDDTVLSSNNPLEKQEIKTVRIVKRESERRQRDREKTFNAKCDPLVEEDDSSQGSSVLFRPMALPQTLPLKPSTLPVKTNEHKSAELSPVFKSEAARQIITEVSKKSPSAQSQRRAIPKEHRRHYTAPHENLAALENLEGRRARDDLDIERTLRQRIDAPDLVRSTLSNKELKYSEETIDNILSTPNKIFIPERYIPEREPQPSAEEQEKRNKKVESIKKMLSDSAIITASTTSMQNADDMSEDKRNNSSTKPATILEEKKQREHLLQLNQILAKQVMEISKVVAVKNLAALKLAPQPVSTEEEDSSPVTPLPLYQQRENFYS